MGLMSLKASARPLSRNHWNESRWMAIRSGRGSASVMSRARRVRGYGTVRTTVNSSQVESGGRGRYCGDEGTADRATERRSTDGSGVPGRAPRPRNCGLEHTGTHGNPASYRRACVITTPFGALAQAGCARGPRQYAVADPRRQGCWPGRRAGTAPTRPDLGLLDFDAGAGPLEGGLRLVCVLLVDLLEHRLGGGLDQVLGLFEAQAGEGPHLLDDLDLLVAPVGEDDAALRHLLLGARRPAPAGSP